jgi:hypothetical protein
MPGKINHANLQGNRASAIARANIARNRAADILPVIHALQQEGVTTLAGIASALNHQGIPAPRGGTWSAVQVARVLALSNWGPQPNPALRSHAMGPSQLMSKRARDIVIK